MCQSYTEGYDLPGFLSDRKTQDAVVRNLEVIGQAIKDFGVETLATEHPTMPWREIAGMRNVLAHEYLGVDPVMIWETVQTHLDIESEAYKTTRKQMHYGQAFISRQGFVA